MYKNPDDQRRFQRERRTQLRETWLKENGPCVRCGSWQRLEMDHKDPSEKESNVIWSWSEKRRTKELAKCQVLCHLCHKEKTRKERTLPPPPHGTFRRYKSKSVPCRCDLCRKANAIHIAKWRKKTGKDQTFYNQRDLNSPKRY